MGPTTTFDSGTSTTSVEVDAILTATGFGTAGEITADAEESAT